MNYVFERFNDIYEFDRVLANRKNNKVMDGENSSHSSDSSFSGTSSYEESRQLLQKGYKKNYDFMKKELDVFKRTVKITRNKQIKDVYGYAPIVANAIKGYPKAMLRIEKKEAVKKQKTYHFVFSNVGNCNVSSESLQKAGVTLIKLCYLLDLNGVRTKIDVMPKFSIECDDMYGCLVQVKDYRQPFNLMKLSYPISHPSFFRRQGFKALETTKGLTERGWAGTYGRSVGSDSDDLEKIKDFFHNAKMDKDNFIYINYYEIAGADYDVYKLADRKGIFLEK